LPKILKHFWKPASDEYIFRPAEELEIGGEPSPPPPPPVDGTAAPEPEEIAPEPEEPREAEAETKEPKSPIDFAGIQAEAILIDARREAEEYREKARREVEQELEELRKTAQKEGFDRGFAQGIASAVQEGKAQREQMAADQAQAIEDFLEAAAFTRDKVLDESKEELKQLALAIAEKVIRISLRSSEDILRRMVEAAIEKHKRCEWAHIYIADCDVRGSVNTIPELTAALRGISNRVRVIPMVDDESGTCIIEMPDEILDASVSTQLGNIREVLENASTDESGM